MGPEKISTWYSSVIESIGLHDELTLQFNLCLPVKYSKRGVYVENILSENPFFLRFLLRWWKLICPFGASAKTLVGCDQVKTLEDLLRRFDTVDLKIIVVMELLFLHWLSS